MPTRMVLLYIALGLLAIYWNLQARPGDLYFFQDIRARCSGDRTERVLSPLVFAVK